MKHNFRNIEVDLMGLTEQSGVRVGLQRFYAADI
jgi:hypothetical protein